MTDRLIPHAEVVAEHLPVDAEPDQVVVGIETDRGPWVQALLAAGYRVYAINLLVEQNVRFGLKLASHGIVMERGAVLLNDSSAALLARPDMAAMFFGSGAAPAEDGAGAGLRCQRPRSDTLPGADAHRCKPACGLTAG